MLPSPPLPLPGPLANYTGTYFHPAYRNATVETRNDALFINRSETTWQLHIHLEHVSDNYFMAYSGLESIVLKQAMPAEFEVRSDGVVGRFGLAAEPEMDGEKIWFDRIDG